MKTYRLESPPPLADLVHAARGGEEVVLTEHNQPVARIIATKAGEHGQGARPRFGCLAGKIEMAPDFDEALDDFRG